MKLVYRLAVVHDARVAPFVGAWIETDWHGHYLTAESVAPFVGAWIET